MRFVLHIRHWWKLQNLLDRIPNAIHGVTITSVAVPNAQNILRVAYRQDGATNFLQRYARESRHDRGMYQHHDKDFVSYVLSTNQRENDLFPVPKPNQLVMFAVHTQFLDRSIKSYRLESPFGKRIIHFPPFEFPG